VLHSFSTNADIVTMLLQKFVDKPAKYIKIQTLFWNEETTKNI